MEVFSVFATLSLADMLSGPLGKIRQSMQNVNLATAALGDRMGKLALSMAPVAIAAGAVLGVFSKCVSTAAGFEDQMAKVGAVSRASAEDMVILEAKARELGATTQFSAAQVAQAEQYLAMAGFKAHENVAALPGVLNLAAATATDLGRAADISSDILGAFGMKAEEMGRVADALALTCSTANTDMEKLGDTMKYVAPVARMAGMSLEETAAMAGMLGNVGIKGSQAGTTLKAMLNKLGSPSKEAQEIFQKLGVTVKDSAGNLRSPIKVLGEMAAGLKNMGSAEQIAALKAIVGEEAIAGFSELIKQQGIGALEEYAKQLEEAGGSAEQMAARMNDTLAGSLRNMGSAWESVQITIGKIFLPVARKVVDIVTVLFRVLDSFAQSPIGATILKIMGAMAAAVVAVTGLSAGMWALSKIGPLIVKSFLPIKTALLGLGWPVLAVIAAIAALYVAYKNNFGGIADTLDRWGRNISMVVRGVISIFQSLKGSTFEIRGELAKDIKAAGLEKFVVTVGKIVFRIKEFFSGLWDSLNFDGALSALAPAAATLGRVLDSLGNAIASVFGVQITSASNSARGLGEILGGALSWSLEALATVFVGVARGVEVVVSLFRLVAAVLTGDFSGACTHAGQIWNNICDQFMAFANLFRIGDWIRNAWAKAQEYLSSINLFESGAKLLDTFIQGITSKISGLVETVSGALGKVREFLPFSDAHTGPLSSLTLSGSRLMTTLGEGMNAGFPALQSTLSSKLSAVGEGISKFWNGLWASDEMAIPAANIETPNIPEGTGISADMAERQAQRDRMSGNMAASPQSWTINVANITLPNVKDAQDFYNDLQAAATQYAG